MGAGVGGGGSDAGSRAGLGRLLEQTGSEAVAVGLSRVQRASLAGFEVGRWRRCGSDQRAMTGGLGGFSRVGTGV